MKPSADATREWTPLLSGESQAQAHDVVRTLARILGEHRDQTLRAPEQALRSLTFSYADRAFPGNGYDELAEQFLDEAIEGVHEEPLRPVLHGGLLTIAWVIDHLGVGDEDDSEVDEAILEQLEADDWAGDYDLVSGLVGIGIYAVSRAQRESGRAVLSRVFDLLEARAVRAKEGLTWHTPSRSLPPAQRAMAPDGYYNTGVAHGVAGVLGLATAVREAGVESDRAGRLASGAIAWLESVACNRPSTRYPQWVPGGPDSCDSGNALASGRCAWCYGDPGIAVQLWFAGRSTNALELMVECVDRPAGAAAVRDAGLCHGSAGWAHMLNRVAQSSGDARLRKAAVTWYERTLEFRRPGHGLGGYRSYYPESSEPWIDDPTFLTGIAGIALGLLAASTDIPPMWDRFLALR